MSAKFPIAFFILFFISPAINFSNTHHIGSGFPFANLTQAAAAANPGDTILFHSGIYPGGDYIANLQGNSQYPIYILAKVGDTVVIDGGSNAWQFSDGAHLYFKGFVFEHQTSNGVNMDDGGTYATPSHHLIFDSCTFRDINATGNNDLLKLSGVDSFEVRNCIFLNGSSGGGDGIDMVGCHDGLIKNCRFENMGAGSIQSKGGSRNIRIEANFFRNGGQRSLNLGGSTGMQFFRPDTAPYEAADLKVYSNIFVGSEAPIAYVGCINTEVVNNTIYLPGNWVIRILQENLDPQVATCSNNIFRNNIIYRDNQLSTDCNIGPNTAPATFIFSNNHWFHSQNSSWSGPSLPVVDSNSIIGNDPLFVDASTENFSLQQGSPDIAIGYSLSEPQSDFSGNQFSLPRSIGALEYNISSEIAFNFCCKKIFSYYDSRSNKLIFDFSGCKKEVLRNHTIEFFSITGTKILNYENIIDNYLMIDKHFLCAGIIVYRIFSETHFIGSGKLFLPD